MTQPSYLSSKADRREDYSALEDGELMSLIEEQDRDIAEKSGRPPLAITKILRSAD